MTDKLIEDMFKFFEYCGIEDKLQQFRQDDTNYYKMKANFYRLRIRERYNNFNTDDYDFTDTFDGYESFADWFLNSPIWQPIFLMASLLIILFLICNCVCGKSKSNNYRDSSQEA